MKEKQQVESIAEQVVSVMLVLVVVRGHIIIIIIHHVYKPLRTCYAMLQYQNKIFHALSDGFHLTRDRFNIA